MDGDLDTKTPEELKAEVLKLRAAIRQHRDASGHDLCWYVPELWDALPERQEPNPTVPPTAEFLSQCRAYRASLERIVPLRRPCPYCKGLGSDPKVGRCPLCNPYCDACQMRWPTRLSDDCPRCNPMFPAVEQRVSRPLTPHETVFLTGIRLAASQDVSYEKMFQFVAWEWMFQAPKEALIPTSFEPASMLHP